MRKRQLKYYIFQYPAIIWIIVWFVYFLLHLQISVQLAVINPTILTLSQWIVYHTVSKKLIPKYYETKIWRFLILSFLLVLLFTAIASFSENLIINKLDESLVKSPPLMLSAFMQFILIYIIVWVCVSLHIFQKERDAQKQMEVLKTEKTETELKFLRAQINPHFLFNALNNIYTITYIGDKTAPEKIAMLSDMLRYVLYDCNADLVPLGQEVKYLKNYIAFQQLKTEKEQRIDMDLQVENYNIRIAPMILMPFVENAFKHSRIIKDKKGFVEMKLKQKGDNFSFAVKNSIPPNKTEGNSSNSGIGIENLKSRLKLIYDDRFSLTTEDNGNTYYVNLKIGIE
jgi:sensor histidine kinase YesM